MSELLDDFAEFADFFDHVWLLPLLKFLPLRGFLVMFLLLGRKTGVGRKKNIGYFSLALIDAVAKENGNKFHNNMLYQELQFKLQVMLKTLHTQWGPTEREEKKKHQ